MERDYRAFFSKYNKRVYIHVQCVSLEVPLKFEGISLEGAVCCLRLRQQYRSDVNRIISNLGTVRVLYTVNSKQACFST